MSKRVIIKQAKSFWSPSLGMDRAYGKVDDTVVDFGETSTYKGAFVKVTVQKNRDGRWATGMDEDSSSLLLIQDEKERKKEQARLKAKRERLEKILNEDLSGKSDYWLRLYFSLVDGANDLELNLEEPEDEIKYSVLVAGGFVAPSKDDLINREEYATCRFYVYDPNEEKSKNKTTTIRRRKLTNIVYNYRNDKDRIYYLCKNLSLPASKSQDADELFITLDTHINQVNSNEFEKIEAILNKTPQELVVMVIVDEAITKKIFPYNKDQKMHYFQNNPIGRNKEQIVDYFSLGKNNDAFAQLADIVESYE